MKVKSFLLGVVFISCFFVSYALQAAESVLEKRLNKTHAANENPFAIAFYRPTYILPYYYTGSPDTTVYHGTTPNGQGIMHSELKAQLSLVVPVFQHLFNYPDTSLNVAYTQLNYWQVYASSQYFRETNYEPEIFVESHFHRNWLARFGFDHQSNGRGGDLERSWNRVVGAVQVSEGNWLVGLRAWDLIFKGQSSDLHNPHIAHYLGYENLLFAYKFHKAVLSLEAQNLESGLSRGYIEASASYPLSKHFAAYVQYFRGYGQSLIEYNHFTQSAGIGIALSNWI
jgi:phospholipase A1